MGGAGRSSVDLQRSAARPRPVVVTARRLVKRAAAGYDRARPPRRDGIVVLLYHRVGGASGLEIDLPVDRFRAQMAWLAATRPIVSLDRAIELLDGEESEGPAPVVVTFDDGTADFLTHALPVLVAHGAPATLYLATRHIEEQAAFPRGGRPLSWSAVREVVDSSLVTLGSHTHGHLLLDRAPPEVAAADLDRSIGLIHDRVGVAVDHFAYPKNVAGSKPAEREVRARFRSAAVGGCRPNVVGLTDRYRLRRSPIQVTDDLRWFRRKADGGLRAEEHLRRAANRLRYQGATT